MAIFETNLPSRHLRYEAICWNGGPGWFLVRPMRAEVTSAWHDGRGHCRAGFGVPVTPTAPACLSPGFPPIRGCSNTNQTQFPPMVSLCLLHAELLQQLPGTVIPGSALMKKMGSASSLPPPYLPPSRNIICPLL